MKYLLIACNLLVITTSVIAQVTTDPSTGNVGIKNNSPTYTLDVNGTLRTTSDAIVPYLNGQYIGPGLNGTSNLAVGREVLNNPNSTGNGNVAVGIGILKSNTSGFWNIGFGTNVLSLNTTGYQNVGIGIYALNSNTGGNNNTSVGYAALSGNTIGYENSAYGYGAVASNTSGVRNVGIGTQSLYLMTNGYMNTCVGYAAGFNLTSGGGNTFVGSYQSAGVTGNDNTIIGASPGFVPIGLTTGNSNTIIGGNINNLAPNLSGHVILADGEGHQRIVVNENGNVGVNNNEPLELLHLKGGNVSGIRLESSINCSIVDFYSHGANHNYRLSSGYSTDGVEILASAEASGSPVNSILTAKYNGYVGIGTTNPAYNLDVKNQLRIGAQGGNDFTLIGGGAGLGASVKLFFSDGVENTRLTVNNDSWLNASHGNVLIGKTSQLNTSYKLDVAGRLRADQVVVNTTGADFVFKSDYNLLPLTKVYAYIRAYHHLPDVPSQTQMQNEGMDVGELNRRLLQKVEELTLYVIQQQKDIKSLKASNRKLHQKIQHLYSR